MWFAHKTSATDNEIPALVKRHSEIHGKDGSSGSSWNAQVCMSGDARSPKGGEWYDERRSPSGFRCKFWKCACNLSSFPYILSCLQAKITAQGKLLLSGPLICSEGTSAINFKGKEFQVFFFEQSIILSEAVGKKTQFSNPGYNYKAHIQVNMRSFICYCC